MEPPSIRIAVTGSRGKSGVVRLLQKVFQAQGLRSWARITGVIPRELGPLGERPILRPSGAHVEEMKWWLRSLPGDAQAVVMENSAVTPEFQGLCSRWLAPTATVLTNLRPDHEAQWGPGEENVLRALAPGLPKGGAVVLLRELSERPMVAYWVRKRGLRLIPAEPLPDLPPHWSANRGLVLALCRHLGFEEGPCRRAMEDLRPDLADFCLLPLGSARLAFAFSANDLTTTEELFGSLGWDRAGTEILYNHRADRTDRLRSFQDWMLGRWKAVHVIGHRPPAGPLSSHYVPLKSPEELALFLKDRGNILGCGNAVYGLPLRLKLALEEGRLSI